MKTQIYDDITQRLIAQLEAGTVPWRSPYFCKGGFPRNYSTRKQYSGINVFLLGCQRFTSPDFMTFLQAKALGGYVRKGEKGFLVVKYGTYTKEEDAAQETVGEAKTRGYLKGYTVFHTSRIDGIDYPAEIRPPELTLTEKTVHAREIVAGMPNAPAIRKGSAVPSYRPATDSVHMPETGFFSDEEAYYSTLFHELGHSTGHASRLARKSLMENLGIAVTGDTARKTYAEEELVAEMTASFLNAHASIVESELANSAAYLQSWLEALKSKDAKGWIIRAAAQAQKAASYILNSQPEANRP